jgi:tRNA G10  N-methylase Trm11
MSYLAILGRQPAISAAELISLYPDKITLVGSEAALINSDKVDLSRLGGTIKLVEVLNIEPKTDLNILLPTLPAMLQPYLPSSKSAIGLSLYGSSIDPKAAFAASLSLKKQLRLAGVNVRVVPGLQLDAAQILHNKLLERGADIVIMTDQKNTYIGMTRQIQDIERYGKRDYERPKRSAKVGMLPPKLAQIMINLASPQTHSTILDPFCGTGVILQEALLMGYPAYGTDIDPALIEMTRTNLAWLAKEFGRLPEHKLETGDATQKKWSQPIGAIVTEGYLGPPLSSQPSEEHIKSLMFESKQLTLNFLTNLRPQIEALTPICFTLPAWKINNTFHRLNILDQIEALGYTLKQFLPIQQTSLLYARKNQFVGRELITLIRK